MKELLWAVEGSEECEWNRLSNLMAFIANKLRFSEDAPVTHPRDINPFMVKNKSATRDTGDDWSWIAAEEARKKAAANGG